LLSHPDSQHATDTDTRRILYCAERLCTLRGMTNVRRISHTNTTHQQQHTLQHSQTLRHERPRLYVRTPMLTDPRTKPLELQRDRCKCTPAEPRLSRRSMRPGHAARTPSASCQPRVGAARGTCPCTCGQRVCGQRGAWVPSVCRSACAVVLVVRWSAWRGAHRGACSLTLWLTRGACSTTTCCGCWWWCCALIRALHDRRQAPT